MIKNHKIESIKKSPIEFNLIMEIKRVTCTCGWYIDAHLGVSKALRKYSRHIYDEVMLG